MTDNISGVQLVRRLGPVDATAIGLGSMLGAGVFAVFAPAAASAGGALPVALLLAGFVAYCNAVASAQLAAAYPTSGGTYFYGRERLGPWWGFTAGWGFVVGKTASCAAMALTFASYAAPAFPRPVAVAAVVALTAVDYRGVTRTALVTRILLAVVLAVLLLTIALSTPDFSEVDIVGGTPGGVLQAAGLLFFAFAGYARIATLGEEVRDPRRTIPRAILGALAIALVVYLAVGLTLLAVLGPRRLAASTAPLADALHATGHPVWIVTVGAAAASLGALLALVAGVGRTALAMARNRDLPAWLDRVHPRFAVPHHAELAVAAVVCVVVLVADLREVIGFSSFGVLVYYAIANLSAFTQPRADRRAPRALNVVGLIGCLVLAVTLPATAVLIGLGVFAAGLAGRAVATGRRRC
ncbi:MAG TPA: APC family permease [Actinophytocola sp.]|jgi:APA family basic amino acid/polyamine antiporter|nr:APC family permease [Actinophytocola sp.]